MLAAIILLGALAQFLGWLLRLPAILLLLLLGFLAGPVGGIIVPDELFGKLLLPFVSLAVALILFEGGLTLNLRELRGGGRVVIALVTVGALVTWILSSLAAFWLMGIGYELSILLGAILTVTGPTVVLPLLRFIRPVGAVGPILKWEGIVIDPIGAVLALIAFEVITESRVEGAVSHAVWTVAKTLIGGAVIGAGGATLLIAAIRKFWIPDHLQTLLTTTLVVSVFTGANWVFHESGLMAVTIMGIVMANQRSADVRHILEFKENLRVFLLSAVFVLLSARLSLADFATLGPGVVAFLVVMILVVRPVSVWVSTTSARMPWRERVFLASLAPRGIVAAAVASIFTLALEKKGMAQARLLVPIVFSTIVGTVLIYGLTGPMIARALGLANADPQGLLIVGAGPFARELSKATESCGFRTLLVDTNRENTLAAQMAGLKTHFGSILAEDTIERLELAGLGRLLALTSNDEVNSLATNRFAHIFGRARLFQLPPKGSEVGKSKLGASFHGRLLFNEAATYLKLDELMGAGASIRATKLTVQFDLESFRARHGESAMPLLIATDHAKLSVMVVGEKLSIRPGQTLVYLTTSPKAPPQAITAPASDADIRDAGTST